VGARKDTQAKAPRSLRDYYLYLMIVAVAIIVRIPFLKTFDLVSYDGTYYIKYARLLLQGAYRTGFIPIGYPLFIAIFIPIIGDAVRAAQTVSVLAGLGSLIVFHKLCREYISSRYAFIAAVILACTPLFIRLTTTTMSEALYLFWVLLGLLFFAREKRFLSGLSLGWAASTRPEALGIFAVLALLTIRRPKRLGILLAGFLVIYSANFAAQTFARGKPTFVGKTKLFGQSAEHWGAREVWLDFERRDEALQDVGGTEQHIIGDYVGRMPKELLLLLRHASPVLLLLALYGIYRRRSFLLASFLPFVVYPIFTARPQTRFIFPHIPMLIIFAFIGLEAVRKRRIVVPLFVLLLLSVVAGYAVNRDQVIEPIAKYYGWTKELGISLGDRMAPGDKVADRKPFFAFYAGGDYVEIPVARYNDTMEYLASNDVKFLALNNPTIQSFRPALMPLLFDRSVVAGELRYTQVFYSPDLLLYQKSLNADPLRRESVVQLPDTRIYGPSWSPDGKMIAFSVTDYPGRNGVYVFSVEAGGHLRIADLERLDYPVAWSPDSRRIAFHAPNEGNLDIAAYDVSGTLEWIVSHEGRDTSPSWSRDGREIVFCSDRSGKNDIWLKNLENGRLEQVTTDGGYGSPTFSPDGTRIAWIRDNGLHIFDRSAAVASRVEAPRQVISHAAWSPDGRFIAVTARDWGTPDIYLLTADGRSALLLTKTARHEVQPTWRPDGGALATIVRSPEGAELCILTGLEPYENRLLEEYPFGILDEAE
jgi:TolB protein